MDWPTISVLAPHRKALDALCQRHHVRRLEAFGSVFQDSFDPHASDVDFIVEFESDYDLAPWLAGYFELREALEQLVDRPVDLVMAAALTDPYFIREISQTRRVLYAA